MIRHLEGVGSLKNIIAKLLKINKLSTNYLQKIFTKT